MHCVIVFFKFSIQNFSYIFTFTFSYYNYNKGVEEEEEEEERFIFPTTTTLVHTLNKFIKLKFYTWLEKKR